MPGDPRVLNLLEDMLDSGMTPEEVCSGCPELLPEVKERWREFRQVDEALGAIFPGLHTPTVADAAVKVATSAGLPQIPGYIIDEVLGYGGMGVVYKARQQALDRVVAVKMLIAGPFASPLELGRFRRETAALACLKHPNIVQVYDAGGVDGRPYLAMELVDGGTLAQKIAGAPLPARNAAELLAILAAAVDVAHQAGIVHRDLKPVNILLAADGTPKVTDFGLARRLEVDGGLTQTGVTVGTPNYMAPEQAGGQARAIGPAVDVYALGAILYETLTGRPPFRAETPAETIRQVIDHEPIHPARLNVAIPRDLETICLKCLQKDPGKRYASAAQLAADLGRFLRHEPIQARPTGRLEHFVRWVRRRPAVAGLIAALTLLLIVGGISAALQYRQLAAARDREEQTDREVRAVLTAVRGSLEDGWTSQDFMKLTTAASEANRAVDIARSGAASAAARQRAEAVRSDCDGLLARAKKNSALREATLDIATPQEPDDFVVHEVGLKASSAQPSVDEQYAAAFRRWGLDVDGTPEAAVVTRLGAEPDAVISDLIAALDDWMLARRRLRYPEAEWRRLSRIAEPLDHSERRRRLRRLLIGESSPSPTSVAALVGSGASWPAVWQLARGDNWQQLRDLRREMNLRTDPAPTIVLLARGLDAVGDPAEAEQVLREAAMVRPDQALLLDALGKHLMRRGQHGLEIAIEYLRAARALRPRLGVALSTALIGARRAEEAEDIVRELLGQQGETPLLYCCLGLSLDAQKKHGKAEEAYRKAIALGPDFADAYSNLGMCLADQQRYDEAERACRKAVELRPERAESYFSLGHLLSERKNEAAAAEAYRKAIAIRPDWANAHYNLGVVLCRQGEPAAAEQAFRRAVALQPDSAWAHNNLGIVLIQQRKPAAATEEFRNAIALQPDFSEAFNNLGMALSQQGEPGAAEEAFRKAVALQPDLARAHFNLALVLMQQARFAEAHDSAKKARDLMPAEDPERKEMQRLSDQCQRYVILDAKLPSVLRGAEKPANAAEQIEFAELCVIKRLHAAAAQFYADAFRADPKLADDMSSGRRYNAACAAALAGCGRGKDADKLDNGGRARWRRQACEWLRSDLARWSELLVGGTADSRTVVASQLRRWQSDDDLAGLRDPRLLGALPAGERQHCFALWEDVAAVLDRAQAIK
jgi:serine/threonine-protein kinase